MKTILKSKHTRRNFFLIVLCIILVIILLRLFVLPLFEPTHPSLPLVRIPKEPVGLVVISRLLDSLLVSLLVTVGVGTFLYFIEVPEDEKKFEIIESFKIGEIFKTERNNTEIWFFSGGTGRYIRTVTLPELSIIAKETNTHKSFKLQLLNPSNHKLCEDYAYYRNSLRSASKGPIQWTVSTAKNEVIATIVTAVIFKSNNALLDLTICLKNNFSSLRVDLSSNVAVVTKEDAQEPALVCRNSSFLYRSYKEEILQTFKQYPAINTTKNFSFSIQTLTKQQIVEILSDLQIEVALIDTDLEQILKLIKEQKNPYA